MQESSWHVVHVVANHERRVAHHFSARYLEHYLPLYSERSQWTDRAVQLERPLFPGYIFIRYSPNVKLSIISTPGVLRLLGDSSFHTVSETEIAAIREGLSSGCVLRPHPPIALGTEVRVQSGVFQGIKGVVTELRQRCKVVIRFAAVEQCFSVELSPEELEIVACPVPDADRSASYVLCSA